jgi:AP2-associated kinase
MKKIFSRKDPLISLGGGPGLAGATSSVVGSAAQTLGGPWTVGRHVVSAEEIIAEGGFGVVFLVRGQSSTKDEKRFYALKRLFVNNDRDLAICKREIAIVVMTFLRQTVSNLNSPFVTDSYCRFLAFYF